MEVDEHNEEIEKDFSPNDGALFCGKTPSGIFKSRVRLKFTFLFRLKVLGFPMSLIIFYLVLVFFVT